MRGGLSRWLYFFGLNVRHSIQDLLIALGFGHWCVYDDPTHPDYSGFTAGICYERGIHKGRHPDDEW